MKQPILAVVGLMAILTRVAAADPASEVPLFDGRSFAGWEGDLGKTWRIEEGAIVGGSLATTVPHNEFLRTKRSYTNFVLRLQFRLLGTEGFVNAGVQVRSHPVENPPYELSGYQCDMGDGWWGALYDESRRNKVLVKPDPEAVKKAIRPGEWNEYRIRCEGRRIQSWINDVAMIDYTEPEDSIPQQGIIGLQIHGGGKAEAWYRDLFVQGLP